MASSPASHLSLRQLRAFVQVIRQGSFTAGARALHLTQSAASLLVKELEEQLGVQLIDRTTRQIALTEAGSEFLARTERILADLDDAVGSTQDLLHKRRGRVTLAATPTIAATLVPAVVSAFRTAHPAIELRLADVPTQQVIRMVRDGDADLGFGVFLAVEDDLERQPLLRHAMGVMVPASWPLARRRRPLRWADLAGVPRIGLSPQSGFGAILAPVFEQAGLAAQCSFEVGNLQTAVGLVQADVGITLVPAYVGQRLASSRAVYRELQEPRVSRDLELLVRTQRTLSPSAQALRDLLAAHCRQLQD